MRHVLRHVRVTLLAALLAGPAAAAAGELSLTPYVWIPGVTGSFGAPGGDTGLGSRLSVDTHRFSDSLRLGGAMLNLTWRQDRFVAFGDWTYANVRSEADTVFALLYPSVSLQVRGNVLQAFSGYTVVEEGGARVSLFLGGRLYDLYGAIAYSGGSLPDVKADGSSTWVDAVAGLRLDARFAERWLLHLRGDLGAGGSNSWQAYAAAGYQFSWGALLGGYRHLSIDRGEGSLQMNLSLSGPFVGGHFTF